MAGVPVAARFATLNKRGDSGAWIGACQLRLQGGLALAAGDRETAEQRLRMALERYRPLSTPLDVAVTLADLWQVLDANSAEAQSLAAEALEIVRRFPVPGHSARSERLFNGRAAPIAAASESRV